MSVVALASAKGSPGVTTLAHRLADVMARRSPAALGGRPVVVVEADLAGGDLAARRGLAGAPGLASLALSARRSLDSASVLSHCQRLGEVHVLAGVAGCRQGSVVAPLVPRLLDALREIDALVVLDLGRLGPPAGSDEPSPLRLADLLALVTRSDAECVVHARSAVDSLRSQSIQPELVLVGRPEYPLPAIAAAVGAPVLGAIAFSPAEAAVDPSRATRGRRGELARSVEGLATVLAGRLGRTCAAGPPVELQVRSEEGRDARPEREPSIVRLRAVPRASSPLAPA
jgi:MinD-like ATPase involved in chromosome partitioning or flagellar assembly